MNKLTQLIDKLGVEVITNPLPTRLNGLYFADTYNNYIIINRNVKSESKLREVLSHELGHYFTSILTNTASHYSDYLVKLNVHRNEFRAVRWACNYLMPDMDVIGAIIDGHVTLDALCNHFNVSKELLTMKFYFMSLHGLSWRIDDRRFLILSDLPSVYIFEEI
ncbi:ImmA/IrrE family metallo-endopeptidase [Fusibacter paucivorans]|uniref:ImmA/IrrE family metallo-endopeptidase n=1 Tax=Fusibacter paucivorans TaxID=76009 RepID=A0ABS5PTQ4_9FIRM|nr:ImmA/IrrE family metallo-endopeptidase [Fusibacter paucivorans]MBS7528555.1 ImmA/IrrE family metallo-endopeptidase [Fusibacter paucivorans]